MRRFEQPVHGQAYGEDEIEEGEPEMVPCAQPALLVVSDIRASRNQYLPPDRRRQLVKIVL